MIKKRFTSFCAAPSAAFILIFCANAHAADVEASRQHFKQGVNLFKEGVWEGALEEFRQSFKLNPQWKIRINIASCYLHLERFDDAMMELTFAVDEAGEKMKPEIEAVVELNKEMLEEKLVSLKMDAPVGEDVALLVDGKQVPRLTKEGILYLEPGKHAVEVKYLGKAILSGTFDLATPGLQQALRVKKLLPEEAQPRKPRSLKQRWELWTGLSLIVAGGAFLGGYGYFQYKINDYNETLKDARYHTMPDMDVCECYSRTGSELEACSPDVPTESYRQEVLDICDQKGGLTAGQFVLLSLGIASAVAGIVLTTHDLVKHHREKGSAGLETEKKLSLNVTPIFGARVVGLGLGGAF
jgi:tetratricopeptide (TPR) repeat protein